MQLRELTVKPDHIFEIYGLERMVLKDAVTGQAIAVAERMGGHTWTVTADDQSATTIDRNDAINTMNDMALVIGRKENPALTGYVVIDPTYLINGEPVNIRDLP